MTRYSASLSHLIISVLIFGSFALWVYFIWFGQVFFDIGGAQEPLLMIACVDVVLGPIMTLIIFNPGKKGLKMDLTLIALVQISALSYGAYTIHKGKPGMILFKDGDFQNITESAIDRSKYPNESLQQYSLTPTLAIVDRSSRDAKAAKLLSSIVSEELDYPFYKPLAEQPDISTMLDGALPFDALVNSSDRNKTSVMDFLQGRSQEDFAFYIITNNEEQRILVADAHNGDLIATLDYMLVAQSSLKEKDAAAAQPNSG